MLAANNIWDCAATTLHDGGQVRPTLRDALRLRRTMDVPVAGTRLSDITIESMRTAFASDAETPPGGVDPAVLVGLGRAVHVPFYVRTDSGEPHAPDRTPESRQDVAEGGADRACRPTVERPGDRHPAAPAPRLVRTRPRDHPHSPAAGLRSDELIRATSAMCAGRKTAPSSMCASSVEKTGRFRARLRWFRSWTTTSTLGWRASRPPLNAAPPPGDSPRGPPTARLFVGADGDRITRGTRQYRVLRAVRQAGIDAERGPRCARARTARRVRYRVGQLRGQCLHADDPARAVIEGETGPTL